MVDGSSGGLSRWWWRSCRAPWRLDGYPLGWRCHAIATSHYHCHFPGWREGEAVHSWLGMAMGVESRRRQRAPPIMRRFLRHGDGTKLCGHKFVGTLSIEWCSKGFFLTGLTRGFISNSRGIKRYRFSFLFKQLIKQRSVAPNEYATSIDVRTT
jgi:hypothetical protein